jgi:hypothetical protein
MQRLWFYHSPRPDLYEPGVYRIVAERCGEVAGAAHQSPKNLALVAAGMFSTRWINTYIPSSVIGDLSTLGYCAPGPSRAWSRFAAEAEDPQGVSEADCSSIQLDALTAGTNDVSTFFSIRLRYADIGVSQMKVSDIPAAVVSFTVSQSTLCLNFALLPEFLHIAYLLRDASKHQRIRSRNGCQIWEQSPCFWLQNTSHE